MFLTLAKIRPICLPSSLQILTSLDLALSRRDAVTMILLLKRPRRLLPRPPRRLVSSVPRRLPRRLVSSRLGKILSNVRRTKLHLLRRTKLHLLRRIQNGSFVLRRFFMDQRDSIMWLSSKFKPASSQVNNVLKGSCASTNWKQEKLFMWPSSRMPVNLNRVILLVKRGAKAMILANFTWTWGRSLLMQQDVGAHIVCLLIIQDWIMISKFVCFRCSPPV